jgi:hypothetical protein
MIKLACLHLLGRHTKSIWKASDTRKEKQQPSRLQWLLAVVATTSTATVQRPNVVQMHCQLCDVACTGTDTYAAHVRGIKHQRVGFLYTSFMMNFLGQF